MLRSLKALYHLLAAFFAVIWYRFPSRKITVIGVTGTDGKTTTASLIYQILETAGIKTSLITSVKAVIAGKEYETGFHVTTPSSFSIQKYLRQSVDRGDTHFVLEVTSHALSQFRVFGVKFKVAVLTNVTHEHLDWHGSMKRYLETKFILLKNAEIVVLNRDEDDVYNQIISKLQKKNVVTYGIRHNAKVTPARFAFKTKLIGNFNIYNCLAAYSAALCLGIDKKSITHAISEFNGVPGRMQIIVVKPFHVIIDFAHTPNAFEQILRTIKPLVKGKLIHVFGSAAKRDKIKRPLMGEISSKYADIVILTEEDYRDEDVNQIMKQIAQGIPQNKSVFQIADRSAAIRQAVNLASVNDWILVTGKGHEKSICRGKKEYPWSDEKEILKSLINK